MSFKFIPLLLALLAALQAQDHSNLTTNPYNSPEDLVAGMKLFLSTCAACHGREGAGGSNGPSLTTGTFKRGNTDEGLHNTIANGVPGTPMSAFSLRNREVWQLVAYIRELNVRKSAAKATGDSARGERVFADRGCGQCHTARGGGGFSGPDLGQIGLYRSLEQLESAVIDPNRDVAPAYWSLRARTKSGQTISGLRLNEDMDSFQIREASGRLRSVFKAELASHELVRTSPMPSFKDKLQKGELDDLVAFLASLRGAQQ